MRLPDVADIREAIANALDALASYLSDLAARVRGEVKSPVADVTMRVRVKMEYEVEGDSPDEPPFGSVD